MLDTKDTQAPPPTRTKEDHHKPNVKKRKKREHYIIVSRNKHKAQIKTNKKFENLP